MIPIELKIKGLYSYQEEQIIDFKKLTNANIFGIFGSVGSGKSSILEAISFALYGETERLNTREQRNYNLMNLKSEELRIEFIFSVNKNDEEYKSLIELKRSKKKFNDVRIAKKGLYKKSGKEWVPIDDDIDDIIGLNYQNFKRAVIIPQGKFQDFLQLSNTERTRMMKDLFNLDKYELSDKVGKLIIKDESEINRLEGHKTELGDVDEALIKEKEDLLKGVKEHIEKINKKIFDYEKDIKNLEDIKRLYDRRKENEDRLRELNEEEEKYKEIEDKIEKYDNCIKNFKDLIERDNEIKGEIFKIDTELKRLRTALNIVSGELSELLEKKELIKKEFDGREELKIRSNDLSKIIEQRKISSESEEIKKKIVKKNSEFEKNKNKLDKGLKENIKITEEIKKLRGKLKDESELSDIKHWYIEKENIEKEKSESEEKLRKRRDKSKELEIKIKESFKSPVLKDIAVNFDLKKITVQLLKRKKELKNSLLNIENNIRELSLQKELEAFTKEIKDNKPCPLCGSLEHPKVMDIVYVGSELEKEENEKRAVDKKINELEKSEKLLIKLITEYEGELNSINELIEELNKLEDSEKEHLKRFKGDEYKNKEGVINAIEDLNKQKENIKIFENKNEILEEKIEEMRMENENLKDDLNVLRNEETSVNARIESLSSQMLLLEYDDYKNLPIKDITNEADDLIKKYNEIEKTLENIKIEINEKELNKNKLLTSIEINEKILKEEKLKQSNIDKSIKERLKEEGFESQKEIMKILNWDIDIKKQKKALNLHKQKLNLINNNLSSITKEIGKRKFSKEDFEKKSGILNEKKEELRKKLKEEGALREIIKDLKERFIKLKELKEKLDNLYLRNENLNILKNLFKASGFVNYISSIYLRNLCKAADSRFYKLTKQTLNLELSEDNNFLVRDILNNGKLRHIKTLSGGQTFQASLSLAIALADSIKNKSTNDKNFFFMDEGFGTLDKNSLKIVFETLRALQKENRIVGVISHVEEMKEEIDTYLEIVNDSERGSKITPSWDA